MCTSVCGVFTSVCLLTSVCGVFMYVSGGCTSVRCGVCTSVCGVCTSVCVVCTSVFGMCTITGPKACVSQNICVRVFMNKMEMLLVLLFIYIYR